jgi:hypothetical protein
MGKGKKQRGEIEERIKVFKEKKKGEKIKKEGKKR